MITRFRPALLCLLVFSLGPKCFSQSADTSFVASAAESAVQRYRNFIRDQSGIFSGTEYRLPRRTNQEHPFYREYDWFKGTVQYNGELYDEVDLMYDITSDNIIIEHFYNGEEIVLIRTKVESFTIGQERFIHINGASLLPGLPTSGFYQLLYEGKSRLVSRHVKYIEEKIENTKIEIHFNEKTRLYLLKDGVYHRVSSRGDIMKLFRDRKQAVRQYISANKISLSKNNASAFAVVARYYDSLNPETK